MTYFDHNLPYPQAFQDAVERETDRVTADPGTRAIGDAVNARGLADHLGRTAWNNSNVASARSRRGRESDNVPDVVHQMADRATACHLFTAGRAFGDGDYPHSAACHDPEILRSRLQIRGQ
jgi:hypothetical protein